MSDDRRAPDAGNEDDDDALFTRRSMLRAGLLAAGAGAAGALGIAAGIAAFGDPTPERSAPRPGSTPVTTARPSPAPTARATAAAATTAGRAPAHGASPTWLRTWDQPISQLDSYVAWRVGEHFPRRAVMLTIDDGPHPVWTPKYLRLLARHGVQATFSVIGEQVREYPRLVRALATEGHHIGNHTFHHPLNLPALSPRTIRAELEDTTDAVVRASGFRPRQFRAPGGVWGPDVFAEVSRQQMMPLGWDIDPRDWSLPGVDHIRSAMLAARPHDIILCHDGGGDRSQTYAALSSVIPALLARGWTFVTLPAPATV